MSEPTTVAPNLSTGRQSSGDIYSVSANEINLELVEKLMAEPGKYWANYSNREPWWGYIVYDGGKWLGQVVLQQIIQRDFESATIEDLINQILEAYPAD